MFVEAPADRRPIIVTTERSDAVRRAELAKVADVVVAGGYDVDIEQALAAVGARGARVVLCEGGPSLIGQLIAASVLDEMCLSLTPLVVGGTSPRVAHGLTSPDVTPLRLDRVLEADDMLFLRYVRQPGTSTSAASVQSPS